MPEKTPREEIVEHGKPLLIWTMTGLMDAAFLILWVIAQYITARIIEWFALTGLDANSLNIFQLLFAISTLVPVLMWILKDIAIMFIRVCGQIIQAFKEEKAKLSASPDTTQNSNGAISPSSDTTQNLNGAALPSINRLVEQDEDNDDRDSTVVAPKSGKSGSAKP